MFVYVKCPCGRSLRARRSPAAAKVRCWDCRAEVAVPRYREGGRGPIARFRDVDSNELVGTAAGVIVLALMTTIALLVPNVGGPLALVVLTGAALVYLHRIEEAGGEPEEEPAPVDPWSRFGRAIARLALAATLAVALTAPFWLADELRDVAGDLRPVTASLLLASSVWAWVALPLLSYATMARDESGHLGPRRAMAAAWRRPWSTIRALALLPVSVAATEAVLVGVLYLAGWMPAFTLDLFPLPSGASLRSGIVLIDGRAPRFEPGSFALYPDGLARGATLVGSIPLSLQRGLVPRLTILRSYTELSREGYLIARLMISLAVLTIGLGILAVQSHRLGRLARAAPPADEEQEEPEPEPADEPAAVAG